MNEQKKTNPEKQVQQAKGHGEHKVTATKTDQKSKPHNPEGHNQYTKK